MLRKSRLPDSTDPGRPFQAGLAAGRRASCERRQQRKLRSHRAKPIPTLRCENNFREEGNRRGRWGEPQIMRQSSQGSAYVKREGRRSRRVSEPKSKPFKVNLFMLVCVFMCVRACVEINRGDECDLRNGGAFFSQLALSLFFYSPTLSRHHCGRRRRRRRRSITVAPHSSKNSEPRGWSQSVRPEYITPTAALVRATPLLCDVGSRFVVHSPSISLPHFFISVQNIHNTNNEELWYQL